MALKSMMIATLALFSSACVSVPASDTTVSVQTDCAGILKQSTKWVANRDDTPDVDDWAIGVRQVYADATTHIQGVASTLNIGQWAVIMDLDETVLNNVQYQIERDQTCTKYKGESWFEWTQRMQAPLVPGAIEFIKQVNQLGGHVAFVTNRKETEQLATERNLADLNIKRQYDFRILLTYAEPAGSRGKQARFELVPAMLGAMGYSDVAIVAYVGDASGDKPDTLANAKFFCIDQGNMYGSKPCAMPSASGQIR